MDIEQQLRRSLAARPPSADFESAVMTRLRQDTGRPAPVLRRTHAWQAPAALAATVLAAVVGVHWYGEQQRAARDREQLLVALAITSQQLSEAQQRLVRPKETRTQENGT
jgi:hypothetical protein